MAEAEIESRKPAVVGAPPQVLKQQVRTLAANQDIRSLREGGIQAFGSKLPVLQAFQEFLEIERRNARRRLVRMALCLTALLVAVLLAAVLYVGGLSGRVDREMRQLERALSAARGESGALRGDTEAMGRSLADAKDALTRLRSRFDLLEPSAGAAPDFSAVSGAIELLQMVQHSRADQAEADALLERLQHEAEQLALDRRAERQFAARVRRAWAEFARDAEDFAARRGESEARARELTAAARRPIRPESKPTWRNLWKKRKGARRADPPVSVPELAAGLLEDIHRLRFDQTLLRSRENGLSRDLSEWERLRSALAGREEILRRRVADLDRRAAEIQARNQSILARLDGLRKPPAAALN